MEIVRDETVQGVRTTVVRYTEEERRQMAERAAARRAECEKRKRSS